MNPPSDHSAFALICPVCGGEVENVATRPTSSLYVCKECDCDVIVPASAWEIARVKRQQKWPPKRGLGLAVHTKGGLGKNRPALECS